MRPSKLSALLPPEIRHDLVGHTKTKRDAAYEGLTSVSDARSWAEKIDRELAGC